VTADPAEAFAALADGTRRHILRTVARDGPVSATAIAAALPITRQAVSKHLHVLDDAGLVAPERAGRETHWRLRPDPLDAVAAWVNETGSAWDRRLARLARDPS
jgi:DNA-binding transcriptional ArsR family regulator